MKTIRNLSFSSLCLALCLVLPIITGNIQQIGNALAPMHIPVLICGFVCGWQYGLAVGFIAPIMRSMIFGMPVMYPMAAAMAFELAAYGLLSGIMYNILPKKNIYIYPSLIISMLGGRVVWGIARYIMAGLSGSEFGMTAFIAGAFTNAIPGIICHLIIIPLIVMALKKTKLMSK
ncbi:MAG: ECF transporter S component [Clostridia bacterium]|nr:ECF transporter S component [Clostridia bacterium]